MSDFGLCTIIALVSSDPEEVEKFDNLAKYWWDLDGPCQALHIINQPRLQFIQNHTALTNKTVLDIGCGGGILTEALSQLGAIVTGIDASNEVIKTARKHAEQSGYNIDYQNFDAEDFAHLTNSKFDTVICMELLEHVSCPITLIKTCKNLLKPNGQLFLSTINRNPKSWLYAIIGAEYLFKIIPKRTHDYHNFIRPSELHAVLKAEGINLIDLKGIGFNPILKTAKLINNIDVNYLLYAKLN